MKKTFASMFALPQPIDVAKKELHATELDLLEAQRAQEAYAGYVETLKLRRNRLYAQVAGYANSSQAA